MIVEVRHGGVDRCAVVKDPAGYVVVLPWGGEPFGLAQDIHDLITVARGEPCDRDVTLVEDPTAPAPVMWCEARHAVVMRDRAMPVEDQIAACEFLMSLRTEGKPMAALPNYDRTGGYYWSGVA